MIFETVIGIEIHMELLTKSKIFSPSKVSFNEKQNTNINQIDLGLPGTLPVLNKEVVEKSLLAATLLNCQINKRQHFDRKNYFYSDNSKGYQVTQQETPMGYDGCVTINVDGYQKNIKIERIHMEEDTAKQFHKDDITQIDYNRAGQPLIEIVTDASIRTANEAAEYVKTLRIMMEDHQISNAKMEEGSMRCDVNISIRPKGAKFYNTKIEIKNLNSISNIIKAIENEIQDQKEIYLKNGEFKQLTKRFDEATKSNKVMRVKETINDYHYYWEPDIPLFYIREEEITEISKQIKIRPWEFYEKMSYKYNLNHEQISFLLNNKELKELFLATIKLTSDHKQAYNLISTNIKTIVDENQNALNFINSENLSYLINAIANGGISNKVARDVMLEIIKTNDDPKIIIEKNNWGQISDEKIILEQIKIVLSQNQQSIIDFKNGKDKALGFLNGQVLKAFKGKGNPNIVSKLMLEELNRS